MQPSIAEHQQCTLPETHEANNEPSPLLPRQLIYRLYLSHFLSTWNSRLFEFGAILFLASIFPDSLLPMSIYALVRSASTILLSPSIGNWIDKANRLSVVRISIIGQRAAVAGSCGVFLVMKERQPLPASMRKGLFALAVMLACVEKLCSVMNTVAVERDWVVALTVNVPQTRQGLNARMRRIDLLCKLLGPLVISLIAGASTIVAIWLTLGMNCASVFVEYVCIARVYRMAPELQRVDLLESGVIESEMTPNEPSNMQLLSFGNAIAWLQALFQRILPVRSLPFYFHHPAFLPSFSLSLVYLTVLSFSGQMITFLLSAGYKSSDVGIARTVSTLFELSATWAAPRMVKKIGAVRGGIWFLSWQMIWLAVGVSWYFGDVQGKAGTNVFAASVLVGGVILSRVGLWGFDLCAQTIVQDEVDESYRGAFSTVEAALQNLFELISYVSTIIFSRPDQFRWPMLLSVAAVYLAGTLYAAFVRKRRGHLLHPPSCMGLKVGPVDIQDVSN